MSEDLESAVNRALTENLSPRLKESVESLRRKGYSKADIFHLISSCVDSLGSRNSGKLTLMAVEAFLDTLE